MFYLPSLDLIATLIVFLIAFAIASLPLYFAVKLLGGKTSLLKVMGVHILIAIVLALLYFYINIFAGLIGFIIILFIYKVMFKLGWFRAFLAWLLQIVIAFFFIIILAFIFVLILL